MRMTLLTVWRPLRLQTSSLLFSLFHLGLCFFSFFSGFGYAWCVSNRLLIVCVCRLGFVVTQFFGFGFRSRATAMFSFICLFFYSFIHSTRQCDFGSNRIVSSAGIFVSVSILFFFFRFSISFSLHPIAAGAGICCLSAAESLRARFMCVRARKKHRRVAKSRTKRFGGEKC